MVQIFRSDSATKSHLENFHEHGYITFPDIFTDEARMGFLDEVLHLPPVRNFFRKSDTELRALGKPYRLSVKPWNDKGPWADGLFDAPLVRSLLRKIIGQSYHFCHSSLAVSLRGAEGIRFHQDHHHWFHDNPTNLNQRNRWYIQMLYYPNGFSKGDGSLSILAGSQKASPLEFPAERLVRGDFGPYRRVDLELPPGSMVVLNARAFHGVSPKLENSTQDYRLFSNYIFKESGPPHLNTQEIPGHWVNETSKHRRKIFDRQFFQEGCWD